MFKQQCARSHFLIKSEYLDTFYCNWKINMIGHQSKGNKNPEKEACLGNNEWSKQWL